jgi:hypothetical protein
MMELAVLKHKVLECLDVGIMFEQIYPDKEVELSMVFEIYMQHDGEAGLVKFPMYLQKYINEDARWVAHQLMWKMSKEHPPTTAYQIHRAYMAVVGSREEVGRLRAKDIPGRKEVLLAIGKDKWGNVATCYVECLDLPGRRHGAVQWMKDVEPGEHEHMYMDLLDKVEMEMEG